MRYFDEPWPHHTKSTFFELKDWTVIEQASIRLLDRYQTETLTANNCLNIAQAYDIIGDQAFDIILRENDNILNTIADTHKLYPHARQFTKYISFPSFHILPAGMNNQVIHDEAADKSISVVVYLHPLDSVGTALYRSNTVDSLVKEVPWKPNTALFFAGKSQTTWHDFYTRESPRVTLNYFVRSADTVKVAETANYYYFDGLDGPPHPIPKSLPTGVIEKLISGRLLR